MKSRDIFAVAVRMIGLIFVYQGLSAVPTAVANICPVFPHIFWRNVWPATFLVGWPLVVAWWLVRGAPWLMRLAFPEDANHEALEQRKAEPAGSVGFNAENKSLDTSAD